MTGKGKSLFKKIVGQVHLWLGLASGLVIVVISITGCLFAFQKEIADRQYKKVFFVPAQETTALPAGRLLKIAQNALGAGQPVNDITVWKDPKRAWEFMAYKFNDTALTYFGTTEYYRSVFLDPYTGRITGIRDYKTDFFTVVKYLHWSLLLNTRYGQPIVGWSTVIFALMLITGLVLWWPKKWNRANRKKSFSIYWKGKFKRLNYDLHNVLGFYFYIPALILALTGLIYAFQWFEKLVTAAVSGSSVQSEQPVIKSDPSSAGQQTDPLNIAYHSALKANPQCRRINITPASEKEGSLSIYAYNGAETYYSYREMQFDRYSGRLIREQNSNRKNRGERLMDMNYDIHVGAIGGLTGKIIAFLASLVSASLPITGFYIWWNRKKKKGRLIKTHPGLMRKPVAEYAVSESAQ